jgi:hypothetical protein
MLAEWVRVVTDEALGNEAGTTQNLAIAWHREGGVAGFCDNLSIYMTGKLIATSCAGGQSQELGQFRLNPEQLQQVYDWVDSLQPFEIEQTDNATADGMTIQLSLNGLGDTKASEATRQTIETFATNLYVQISQGQ